MQHVNVRVNPIRHFEFEKAEKTLGARLILLQTACTVPYRATVPQTHQCCNAVPTLPYYSIKYSTQGHGVDFLKENTK